MDKIKIIGGTPLKGHVRIGGAKNAVLPLMACALMTDEEMVFHDVPHLTDITTMSEVLRHLGAEVSHEGHVAYLRQKYCQL